MKKSTQIKMGIAIGSYFVIRILVSLIFKM
jgi:hypothetical protein